ncbi:MAG: hypothetical protein NC430_03950 [bacterium]|nr:hypothetical protein [bacterium]MCM1424274.1 hypothetical protein [bacterium]
MGSGGGVTFDYWQAWLLIAVLFIPMFFAGIVMMLKNPELLQKRLQANEGEVEQKQVIAFSGMMFLAAFLVAGLSVRFGWFILPAWISYLAAIIFLSAYAFYAEVLRENRYLSRTVEVQESQEVIDTGLYGIEKKVLEQGLKGYLAYEKKVKYRIIPYIW